MTRDNSKLTKRIFLSPPHMGGEEMLFVQEAFASNYIAPLGPMVDAFEREFADYIGIKHCVAVSSGTAAMQSDIGLKDEVFFCQASFTQKGLKHF
jgi:dTDP-4-amino-4,6-dideoxygalactose transaminase